MNYNFKYYSGYSFDISIKNLTSLNYCSAKLYYGSLVSGIDLNCNSTNYSFTVTKNITAVYDNFTVSIDNGSDKLYFLLSESLLETFVYSPDSTSVTIMGLGLKNLQFSNGYNFIPCEYTFNKILNIESVICKELFSSCPLIQWQDNFIIGSRYLLADSTINSIELLGSSLLIEADFKCDEHTTLRRGISINNRDSYNSLKKANDFNQTLFTYDPSGYSICLREDEIYNISLISQFGNQTFYSNSVEFSCKQGEILNSNAAITLISTILKSRKLFKEENHQILLKSLFHTSSQHSIKNEILPLDFIPSKQSTIPKFSTITNKLFNHETTLFNSKFPEPFKFSGNSSNTITTAAITTTALAKTAVISTTAKTQ
ncbi:hypothetical protein ACTFIV_004383 [Dictyostelium citrinum]